MDNNNMPCQSSDYRESIHLDAVEAPVNYIAPMNERPYSYNYSPPAGAALTNRRVETKIVAIRNARQLATELSLDREGFALAKHRSAVSNFYDDEEVTRIYYPECERLLNRRPGPHGSWFFIT